MQRKNSLDTFTADNTPYSKVFVYTATLAADNNACEDLFTLFVAFLDFAGYFHGIAYLEMGYIFLQRAAFDSIQ